MSSVSLPVTRPAGRALVVGHPGSRARPLDMLRQLGFTCAEANDPYAAMAELCRDPSEYKALILSLAGVYAEELELIGVIKRRHPEVEIWLTDADGRQAALGDALRLGADGLADDDGLHRVAITPPAPQRTRGATAAAVLADELAQLAGAPATGDACRGPADVAVGECGESTGNGTPHDAESPVRGPAGPRQGTADERAAANRESDAEDPGGGDPVLTADELRALLHEPAAPTQATNSEP
jgi:hypothetical protein